MNLLRMAPLARAVGGRLSLVRPPLVAVRCAVQDAADPDLNLQRREATLNLPSRRLDALLRRTSHISTTALEKLINNGGVRVNDEVQKKKAYNVEAGDEVEMFLEHVPENTDLVRVHRVEVVDYELGPSSYHILCVVYKSMVVPSWR
ncbi:RNA-binding S4 domain-containing protein [Aphelenchoides fujianensis]|nr:RNA-binding S4 domain-containing protein [Aphelenchoides fujianensis]